MTKISQFWNQFHSSLDSHCVYQCCTCTLICVDVSSVQGVFEEVWTEDEPGEEMFYVG